MKRPYRILGFFCFFLLHLASSLPALQSFRFHGITEGLPSVSISSIAQDSRGFLWFGTQSGLVCYNGSDYTHFPSVPFAANTLSSNMIQTMMMDRDDILWIGTYAGLDRYDISTGIFTNYTVGNDVVVSLLRDSAGRLWAGTLDGLGCQLPGSDRFVLYKKEFPDRSIGNNTVRHLFEDTTGIIYASTYDGLFEYDPLEDRFIPARLLLPGNPASGGVIYGVQRDAAGDWWVARWGTGLVRIDHRTLAWTVFPLKDNRIYCMNTALDQDLVIAGTWGGGLNVLDKQTGRVTDYTQHSPAGHRLTNDIVYSIFIDNTGLLWLGTNGGGLNVLDPKHSWFSSIDADPEGVSGLPAGKINGMIEDGSGDIWISVTNKGLTRYNPGTGAFTDYRQDPSRPGSLVSNSVYCLFIDSRKTMYLGTDRGLAVYNPESDTFSLVPWYRNTGFTESQMTVSCIGEGPDGSLWIGTYDNGIVRYFPESRIFVRYTRSDADAASLSDNLIYFAQADSRGSVWIGTNKGLNRFDEASGNFTRYLYDRNNLDGISSNTLYSFYEHTDGTLWFGTRNGGLCSWDPETRKFSHITVADGLPSDTIVGICPSRGDFLWVATQNGLVRLDTATRNIYIYKTSDGLLSQQFNAANTTARDGRRYFGTPLGIVYFSEDDLLGNSLGTPPVALTSLTVNNKRLAVPWTKGNTPQLRLRSDEKNISIGYAALDFSPLARYGYSYLLEGYDRSWVPAGDRTFAMYTNLNAGSYVFRVRINGDGKADPEKEARIGILILKPLFLRWYFILLYILLVVACLFLARKIRTGILLEKKVGELEAATIDLRKVNSHLKLLSFQDALTGIPNRRYFEQIVQREWETARIRGNYLSVLMMDIDFFKTYNDTYGHQAGDQALTRVAGAIQRALFRISDVAARYGGEEFVVILPDTNQENARMVCKRIMEAIGVLAIPFGSGIGGCLTISIGSYTGIPAEATSHALFIRKADDALYRAKKDGRNRISICTSDELEV